MKYSLILIFGLLLDAISDVPVVFADPPDDGNLHVIVGGDHADPTTIRDGENVYSTKQSQR